MGEGTGEARRTESSERDPSFPIVGVGGSAGALSAFQELFSLLPVDSGSAFIVISHGDPQGPTLLPDILRRCTEMPVQ
ncbi:MAG: chemotaxis protein CheB, partial [bacterium]